MRAKVYIETTVVSYLTARPNRDVVIAGHQQTTHETMRTTIEEVCRTAGYAPVVICTPEELLED